MRDCVPTSIARHDVTPAEHVFERRDMLKGMAATLAIPALPGMAAAQFAPPDDPRMLAAPRAWPEGFSFTPKAGPGLPADIAQDVTPRREAALFNNFYEFLNGRGGPVWKYTDAYTVDDWTIDVRGACAKPMTIDLEMLDRFAHEERLYHFRCVERWAMNVPWVGFPLRRLLEKVEPTGKARYVRFVSALKRDQMPGLGAPGAAGYSWPYHEGLRMDEAMHDLTFVVTGAYGKPLLKQHGAPVRLAVPWKYGYKQPKAIVRIELVEEQPPTFWSRGNYGHEYGFLSNVNPNIPHPRWTQKFSRWLDTGAVFETPLFNGYENAVAALYPDEPRTPQEPLSAGQRAR